ncbi:hypothetical protein QUF70_11225, partial [Desulfobacterales bacterium HSG17]|nr:hypothetical protein [Desulfobacterales bacterium HSG17]
TENIPENILDAETTIAIDPETFIEETDHDEEPSVRDSTTMDGRDAEDAVVSLDQATVLDLDEGAVIENDTIEDDILDDDDMVLDLGAEAVIEPVENLIPDSEDNQDIDFKQAAETIALLPETDEPETDEDDILDLDTLQKISSEDQPDDKTENDIPILTSEDTADSDNETDISSFGDEKQDQDVDMSALDLIDSLGDPDQSPEIEDSEGILDVLDSEADSFPQEEDGLAMILGKGMETIDEPVEEIPAEKISAPKEPETQEPEAEELETEDTPKPEDNLSQEAVHDIDELTSSISSAQIEASLERVINKIFSQRIEKILIKVVEKAVSEEISKFRASLMEDLTDEDNF